MGFSNSAAPTRANIKKRLLAAQEAVDSALHLSGAAGEDSHMMGELQRASNCIFRAQSILKSNKGARR